MDAPFRHSVERLKKKKNVISAGASLYSERHSRGVPSKPRPKKAFHFKKTKGRSAAGMKTRGNATTGSCRDKDDVLTVWTGAAGSIGSACDEKRCCRKRRQKLWLDRRRLVSDGRKVGRRAANDSEHEGEKKRDAMLVQRGYATFVTSVE